MHGPRRLFVDHTRTMSGAEMGLADAKAWPGSTAFLFEDGPRAPALRGAGLRVVRARRGGGPSVLRRDATILGLARAAHAAIVMDAARARAGKHALVGEAG